MSKKSYLNLFVTEAYTVEGEKKERTKFFKVGAVFPHDKGPGFGIRIMEGISVTGSLVAYPPREDDERNYSSES